MKKQVGTIQIIPGEGIVNTVRQAYWYENRQEWALDVLSCYEGITDEQRMTILRGDATLRPVITTYGVGDPVTIRYIEEPNKRFKQELEKHLTWIKKDCYVFAGKHIVNREVEEYVQEIGKIYLTAIRSPGFFVGMRKIIELRLIRAEKLLGRILKSASIKERKGTVYENFMMELNNLVFKTSTFEIIERINKFAYEDGMESYKRVAEVINDIETGEWRNWSWRTDGIEEPEEVMDVKVTDIDLENTKIWNMEIPKAIKHQQGINYSTPRNRREWAKNIYSVLFTHAYSGMDKNLSQKVIDESITYFETYNLPDLKWWLKQLKVDILNDTTFTHEAFGTEVTQFNSLRGMFHDEILNPTECPHTRGTRRTITKHRKVLEANEK